MDMITVTAKTLDEAITKALIELGTTSDNLDYTIVEKGSAGFLGLFSKNVVIRAKRKKEDDLDEIFASIKGEEKPAKTVKAPAAKEPVKEAVKETVKTAPKEPVKESGREKRREGRKDFSKDSQKAYKEPKQEAKAEVKEAEVQKPMKKIDSAACEAAAKEFLTQVFGAMGMEVTLETSFDDKERELTVNMEGADMGILIGKRGQTMDSLQYLVSLVVNKECDGYVRVKLDTENYRERRKETLETLARNIAYKVKRTRRSVSLEPMNPYERRIIHAALQNDKYVVTRSEGEDPFRHVVISLKRDPRERDNRRGGQNGRGGQGNRGQNKRSEQPAVQETPSVSDDQE